MNVILYGTKKCQETRKVERFLRERRVPYQFRDVGEKPVTEGELKNLSAGRKAEDLIDEKSAAYARRGLAFMEFDAFEEILADNALMRIPILRVDRKILVRPSATEVSASLGL